MKKTNYFMALAVVFSIAGLLASESSATLVTVGADLADTYLDGDGTTASWVGWGGDQEEQVSGTNSREYILVFQLPSLGGESIATADLTASVKSPIWQSWGNIDLYGIRSDAANTVVLGDYGAFGASASGTKIQNSFYTSGTGTGAYESLSSDASGDSALATWLDAQYTAVGVGGYVFLRMQPNTASAIGNHAVQFASANNTSVTTPVLSITTAAVPEPSSLALVGLAMLVMGGLRKKSV